MTQGLGLALGWVGFGLGWVGSGSCWLWIGFALGWVGLALGWLWALFGLCWVGFGLGWLLEEPAGCSWLPLPAPGWPWLAEVLGWFGFFGVGFGFEVGAWRHVVWNCGPTNVRGIHRQG